MMPVERSGEHRAHLRVLVQREEVDDAVDRFGRVQGVQGREDQVAGFRRGQAGLDRLLVSHLSDQDHVRVLTQDAAQGADERFGVGADLALLDDRLAVAVQELDRVFQRDDVLGHRVVDVLDHRRERR